MILQLTNEALEQKLKLKPLDCYYLLLSTEGILLQEARELIWLTAQQQGFQTRNILDMNLSLDWEQLYNQYNMADLFAARQCLEFSCSQLPNESVGQKLQQFISTCQSRTSLNRLIVVSFEQFKPNTTQPVWFKKMLPVSTAISLLSPTQYAFPQWIKKRAHNKGLLLTQEAVLYLAERTEGNLNAAIQSIEKLTLVYASTKEPLNVQELQNTLEDQAQFAIFTLSESILQSEHSRILRILSHFQTCNIAPALVLGCLLRLLRSIAALYYGKRQHSFSLLFKTHNIWPKHQALFQRAVLLIQQDDFYQLFNDAYQIDRYIKGLEKGDIWHQLQHLCFQLAQYFQ